MSELKRLVEEVRRCQNLNEKMEWFDAEGIPTSQFDATHREYYLYVPLINAQQALVDYILEHADEFISKEDA